MTMMIIVIIMIKKSHNNNNNNNNGHNNNYDNNNSNNNNSNDISKNYINYHITEKNDDDVTPENLQKIIKMSIINQKYKIKDRKHDKVTIYKISIILKKSKFFLFSTNLPLVLYIIFQFFFL